MKNRNPILIGQAEEIDLVQPQVRTMLDSPGIYIAGDTNNPELTVVFAVMEPGTVFAMSPDEEPLDHERFLPTLTLRGPYRADEPDEAEPLRARVAELELACAQAVEFATYVEQHAKGKMEDAARRFMSMPFAQELAAVLKAGREADWLPIETAPLDGTPVDLWTDYGRQCNCRFTHHEWNGGKPFAPKAWFPRSPDGPMPVPTHWRRIPAGPATEGAPR